MELAIVYAYAVIGLIKSTYDIRANLQQLPSTTNKFLQNIFEYFMSKHYEWGKHKWISPKGLKARDQREYLSHL